MAQAGAAAKEPVRRRRLDVASRRDEIVVAAIELYSRTPADVVTLDDVAAAAGVSRALVYRYFGSRNELYHEAMQAAAGRLLAVLDVPASGDPFSRLVEAIRRYFDFAEQHATGLLALMSGVTVVPVGPIGSIVQDVRDRLVERLVDALGLPHATGHLRVALRAWMASVEAAALDWLQHRDTERGDVEAMLVLQMLGALQATAAHDRAIARLLARYAEAMSVANPPAPRPPTRGRRG
jgi:AcrR family transcriptional regulator